MANLLATDKRAQILACLVEGCSMRSTARLTGAAKKTIERLLVSAGQACAEYQDKVMMNLKCELVQVDEIWSFTYAKQANVPLSKRNGEDGVGDTWTWIAMDSESKLIPCWRVGGRTAYDAYVFIHDLQKRMAGRIQLTSDGLTSYVNAVESAFGTDIDYAQLIKIYGRGASPEGMPSMEVRYSPPPCTGSRKVRVMGQPDPALISTSHIERQNLSVRMSNRRFTRLTNAFSKKIENHAHAVAINFMHYNFCRVHQTLRVTPAMEAGISDHVWDLEEVAALIP